MAKNAKKKFNAENDLFTFNNAVLIALILALIVLFKTIAASSPLFSAEKKPDLEQDAKTLLDTVAAESKSMSFANSDALLEENIKRLNSMGYNEFKGIAGVKSDFCVYFEDTSGNLIKIEGIKLGIGSEKIRINGHPCN